MSRMSAASWTRAYRLALHLLPAGLRRKHGPAMEALFSRQLGRARTHGRVHGALAGAAGVWDVVRRGAYEPFRPERDPAPRMPPPTTRALLRRHAASFAVALLALTAALLAVFASRRVPALSARGAPAGTVAEVVLLAVPFTAALTIPMAVLVAVLREFTRLGAAGTLAAARRAPGGVRRLVAPVLGASVGVAALAFVVTAELVPRANARLLAVLAEGAPAPSDRTMTIGELRAAARILRPDAGPAARERAAAYEVEVHKKFALPAACVVMALAGVAVALRVPPARISRGAALVVGASGAVFGAYYVVLVTGEDLADRLVVPPIVGMWGANALVLGAALLVVWRRRPTLASVPP